MILSSNRTQLIDFYVHTLGFTIKEDFGSGVMIDLGAGVLEIFDPKDERNYPHRMSLSLMVNDIHQLWKTLKNKVTISHKLRHNDWGDTSFGIVDPDGNRIVFFANSN